MPSAVMKRRRREKTYNVAIIDIRNGSDEGL